MLFRSDRKSTRLNSSHLVISYAVFCLKKKKTIRRTTKQSLQTVFYTLTHASYSSLLSNAQEPGKFLCCASGLARISLNIFFFFNDTATTEIYTLSLHDALPI